MVTVSRTPTIWNQLAENMYLKDSPTAEVRLSERASFSFGRFQSSEGLPEIARPVIGERGYIVALQLKTIPFIEQYFGNKKVSSGSYPVGGVSAIDLQNEPAVLLPNPFDTLVLYVTQSSLDEVADDDRSPRVEQLVWPQGAFDPVIHHLGQALLSSLERQPHAPRIFLDHVLRAIHCHLVYSYGGAKTSHTLYRGGLSSRQMRRATELLEANLEGNIALSEVAAACDLSVSHFARAFRATFRRPPYRWLIERRVERAQELMIRTRLPLADIAIRCGFADQSALNRSFKRIHGIAPGVWRRRSARDRSGAGSSSGGDAVPYRG